ncbi:MAG: indole-3-glycerol-phosphate synthase TrpC, partial [Chloroflexi bacterium]|nr:indole-3-glycerol-phosphate synthase TrpC [Chloroflexota bacterium]
IKDHGDIEKLMQWGVNAVLIGESLLTASNIAVRMKELFDRD